MFEMIDNIFSTITTFIIIAVIIIIAFFVYLIIKSKLVQNEEEMQQRIQKDADEERQRIKDSFEKRYIAMLPSRYDDLPSTVLDEIAALLYEMQQTDTSDWNKCMELKESGIDLCYYTDRYCTANDKLNQLLKKHGKNTENIRYELDLRYIMDSLNI